MSFGSPLLFCLTLLVLITQTDGQESQGDTDNAERIYEATNWMRTLGSVLMQPNWNFCRKGRTYRYKINTKFVLRTCPKDGLLNPRLSKFHTRRILQLFPGIFMTKEQFGQKHKSLLTQEHDGDACCPTVAHGIVAPETLVNVYGQTQEIVHLDCAFQWITQASCLQDNCYGGSGICIMENRTQCLLVWDISSPMPLYFDMFSVPTYCSCKNIGR